MADVLNEMLERVSSAYDKSEGSIFYDVLAPVAEECKKIHTKSDEMLDKRMLDTATGTDLNRAAGEVGVERKLAQYAVGEVRFYGTAGRIITAGALVASEGALYRTVNDCTIGSDGYGTVEIICTEAGTAGNVGVGYVNRLPVTLAGINSVSNLEPITGGYDEETDEELRERALFAVRAPRGGGNENDYISWAMSVDGVGGVRVVRLWRGPGTVKVVIVDANGNVADDSLITAVYDYIETKRPVGAEVTVATASPVPISISVDLVISAGYDPEIVTSSVTEALRAYFQTFKLSGTNVSYARVGAIILDVEGVEDHSNLLLNGAVSNIAIGSEQIPTLGAAYYGY